MEEILEKSKLNKENLYYDEPMAKHTSFKIGGPADVFIKVDNIEELKETLDLSKKNQIPLTIIGNGSNLLVTDKGIRGITAKLNLKDIEIKNENNKQIIKVEAGVPVGLLAQKLLKEEITGFEELSGIPGTIGGAVIMNAGAHGKELKDILKKVTAMDYNGNIHEFTNEECLFSYRNSRFQKEKYIILQATLELEKGNSTEIKGKMDEYMQFRKEKQPIEYPNAGSTFKRGEDFVTAKLIDEAGLKGYKVGGAQVSEKHAGFIVNVDNATAKDVIELTDYIKEKIEEKFGKKINLEIQIIGEK
ncbi:MAG: UDP-N-acetylenolpyruvoylglucosamine reductase [Clostridium sp. 26_22]|nr:MAG: UDP-N-acetylenolpyruvoylglucosamine reductase [Clostridium sp. 26_22]